LYSASGKITVPQSRPSAHNFLPAHSALQNHHGLSDRRFHRYSGSHPTDLSAPESFSVTSTPFRITSDCDFPPQKKFLFLGTGLSKQPHLRVDAFLLEAKGLPHDTWLRCPGIYNEDARAKILLTGSSRPGGPSIVIIFSRFCSLRYFFPRPRLPLETGGFLPS